MVTKDVKSFLKNSYMHCKKSVSELSKSDSGKVLVKDARQLYDFDSISKELYVDKIPQSADSIFASDKRVFLVEYKSGFKKKVSKANFDKSKMTCPDDDSKYCSPYAELFFKNQENEEKILKSSIHIKALESYMTVMQEILPKCGEDAKDKALVYCVVVDDYVEDMENTLNDLAKKTTEDNVIGSLRSSLSRFRKSENRDYYDDEIEVLTPHTFKMLLNRSL